MGTSPCLSDYKDRFDKYVQSRIRMLLRKITREQKMYNYDHDKDRLLRINDYKKTIKMLQLQGC